MFDRSDCMWLCIEVTVSPQIGRLCKSHGQSPDSGGTPLRTIRIEVWVLDSSVIGPENLRIHRKGMDLLRIQCPPHEGPWSVIGLYWHLSGTNPSDLYCQGFFIYPDPVRIHVHRPIMKAVSLDPALFFHPTPKSASLPSKFDLQHNVVLW